MVSSMFFCLVFLFGWTAFQIAVENMRVKREEEDRAKELRDLEARLQRAKTKRQLNEKLKVCCRFLSYPSFSGREGMPQP